MPAPGVPDETFFLGRGLSEIMLLIFVRRPKMVLMHREKSALKLEKQILRCNQCNLGFFDVQAFFFISVQPPALSW